jgi:hypothetical protein
MQPFRIVAIIQEQIKFYLFIHFKITDIMKKAIVLATTLLFSSVAIFAQDGKPKKADTAMMLKVYTCTMHPEVVSDKPGKCPKCGMTLVEKKGTMRIMDSPMHKMPMHKRDSATSKKKMDS